MDSEAAGKQALRKLRGSSIKGVQVIFREYILRDWHNDRRETLSPRQFKISEKRQKDGRRGSNIEIIDTPSNICDIYAANLQKIKNPRQFNPHRKHPTPPRLSIAPASTELMRPLS